MRRNQYISGLVIAALVFGLFINFMSAVPARADIAVYLDNQPLSFDVPPQTINGRVMVPLRAIFEALGASLEWDPETQTATAIKGPTTVKIQIGNNTATINGVARVLDEAPVAIDGRTLAPLRFVTEAFGNDVQWDAASQSVYIAAKAVIDPTIIEYGNTGGNISNDGLAALKGDWLYYSNSHDSGRLYKIKTDGTGKQKLSDDHSESINVAGSWVYYRNFDDGCKIYRIGIDGTGKQKLNEDNSKDVSVAGSWVYYRNTSDGLRLYRVGIDGTGKEKLADTPAWFSSVAGDWVYYSKTGEHTLYRVKTDGSANEKLNYDEYSYINISGGWIYYSNINDGTRLYRIKPDGSGRQKLNDDETLYTNVSGDWAYYNNATDGGKLYRVKTDGSGRQKMADIVCWRINVAGEWIYYSNFGSFDLYRIKTDGSGLETVQ